MTVIRQILTNADNATHNVLRHGAFWGFLAMVGLQAWSIHKGQAFDVQAFGIAIGSILGGVGVGLGASAKAETP